MLCIDVQQEVGDGRGVTSLTEGGR